MTARDADVEDDVGIVGETERSAVESTETEPREEATHHLREALSATESDDERYHIRQALQLLNVEE